MKKILSFILLSLSFLSKSQSINVTTNQFTVPELVNSVLFGNSATNCSNGIISNVSWQTGTNFNSSNGIGYFTNSNSNFPFSSGLILSTGSVISAQGPNINLNNEGTTLWPGDTELFEYVNGLGLDPSLIQYYNATILEFDLQPHSNLFSFDFLFASEEYGLFQCEYSDAFAFFLEDITAGTPPVNLALVPNTNLPISVITVRNSLYNSSCSSSNPQYFANFYPSNAQSNAPINFNGETEVFTAQSIVDPTHTYHVKLVIADRNDTSYDSAVFLKGGSFDAGIGELLVNNQSGISSYDRCPNEVITLQTITSAINNVTYKWYQNGVVLPAITSTSLSVTEAGIYSLELIGINGCTISTNSVTINDIPFDLINEPQNLNSGSGIFDLTSNIPILLSSVPNPSNYEVFFYEGDANGIDFNAFIGNPSQYAGVNNQLIYALVDNSNCFQLKSFILNASASPLNDNCSNSFTLNVGTQFNDFPVVTTNIAASNEAIFPSSFCDGNFSARDVWFSFQVPSTGNVTIETQGNGGLTDTVLEAFSSCTTPISLGCNNDNNPNTNRLTSGNTYSKLILTNLTPGETIFVRAFGKSESMGTFSISAYDSTLGQQQWDAFEVQIKPNPVNEMLFLSSQEDINSIEIYSLLGQKLNHFTPKTNSFQLDFSNFQNGIYLVKIVTNSGSKTQKVVKN
ncbi:MAG: choice-of-anchor L domain-containing protein [Flavobacterium sp.]|jgi:hypothetical protein|uniref:choice-of-anchor L domain-containing protein n=1 Tax=Flavobacterium sp. TaxID=239 RepID=UPI0022CB09DB|nr:choice-of-anchor L domain-containing protein [Flavobacterium sp.]MCZ8169864.1 choice-of-anchor L domain-containing protein [Flavobacterium sp.]MCZ8298069.1 choice-of-anchor L domain-containing protein [Flavobacterium sp.]